MLPNVELPICDGSNPHDWLVKMEYFLVTGQFRDETKMDVVALFVEGRFKQWYVWVLRRGGFRNWQDFKQQFVARFTGSVDAALVTGVLAINQTSSVAYEGHLHSFEEHMKASNEQVQSYAEQVQKLNEHKGDLNETLSAVKEEIATEETLVKQHCTVAEAAVAGWKIATKTDSSDNNADIALEVEKSAAAKRKIMLGKLENQLSERHEENEKLMNLSENAMQEKDKFKRLLSAPAQETLLEADSVDVSCSIDTEIELCNSSSERSTEDLNSLRLKLELAQEKLSVSTKAIGMFSSPVEIVLDKIRLSKQCKEAKIKVKEQQNELGSIRAVSDQTNARQKVVEKKLTALRCSVSNFVSSTTYFQQREERAKTRVRASSDHLKQKNGELGVLRSDQSEIDAAMGKIKQSEAELKSNIVRRDWLGREYYCRQKDYEIFTVLEFNSTRKRQSVVCRFLYGRLVLYCTGADNVLFERLADGRGDVNKVTREYLEHFGSSGLRTLYLVYGDLNPEPYVSWLLDSMETDKRSWQAKIIHKDLITAGFAPNWSTYAALIRAYARARYSDTALVIHREMKEKGLDLTVILYNTLLYMCADIGFVDEALEIFPNMQSCDFSQPPKMSVICLMKVAFSKAYLRADIGVWISGGESRQADQSLDVDSWMSSTDFTKHFHSNKLEGKLGFVGGSIDRFEQAYHRKRKKVFEGKEVAGRAKEKEMFEGTK